MPFVRMPGIAGKVYVPPEDNSIARKNPCRDCFACQFCSDERCSACLRGEECRCGGQAPKQILDTPPKPPCT